MRHPSEGALRRLVDEPAGVADADRVHVAGCPECLAGLAVAQQDAAAVGAALGTGPGTGPAVETAPDMTAGWQRLSRAAAGEGRRRGAAGAGVVPASASRRRAALRSPVVAALGVVALLAGASAAAATDWLPIFHAERVVPVTVSRADLVDLPDLTAYGEVKVVEGVDVHEVPDAAAAERTSGLAVPQVSQLPPGVTGDPTFQVGGRMSVVFTFSAAKAAKAAAVAGEQLPSPPPGLDGSTFRLVAGPGVAEVWSEARGLPALAVGRAVAPSAYSSGIPFSTARDYLLSLPGLPDDVASQLRAFSGDGTTLPLPVPAGLVTSSTADVGGVPATVLTSRDGTLAGVVWVDHGTVTAVAGSLSTDEVLSVARGLR
ncbi:MAG: hypothetical protein ACJ74O_12065 [Frankiaceae bacterium]